MLSQARSRAESSRALAWVTASAAARTVLTGTFVATSVPSYWGRIPSPDYRNVAVRGTRCDRNMLRRRRGEVIWATATVLVATGSAFSARLVNANHEAIPVAQHGAFADGLTWTRFKGRPS